MARNGIGQPVRRIEDARFLTGNGRYIDDHNLPHQLHGHVLLSPYAHARIKGINTSAAEAAPGVVCVLTGKDQEEDVAPREQDAASSTASLSRRRAAASGRSTRSPSMPSPAATAAHLRLRP